MPIKFTLATRIKSITSAHSTATATSTPSKTTSASDRPFDDRSAKQIKKLLSLVFPETGKIHSKLENTEYAHCLITQQVNIWYRKFQVNFYSHMGELKTALLLFKALLLEHIHLLTHCMSHCYLPTYIHKNYSDMELASNSRSAQRKEKLDTDLIKILLLRNLT